MIFLLIYSTYLRQSFCQPVYSSKRPSESHTYVNLIVLHRRQSCLICARHLTFINLRHCRLCSGLFRDSPPLGFERTSHQWCPQNEYSLGIRVPSFSSLHLGVVQSLRSFVISLGMWGHLIGPSDPSYVPISSKTNRQRSIYRSIFSVFA